MTCSKSEPLTKSLEIWYLDARPYRMLRLGGEEQSGANRFFGLDVTNLNCKCYLQQNNFNREFVPAGRSINILPSKYFFIIASMNPTLEYYLGPLATSQELSDQTKELRQILFSKMDLDDESLFLAVKHFIARQTEIHSETISLLNIAIMPGYGSEYFGLGGADWNLKAEFFKSLIIQFPQVVSFKFRYADCACMAGLPVEVFYQILEEGMLQDKANKYYPSTELFEVIQDSKFNFQFDLLLLDKYRQPCSKNEFEEYVDELKEQYKTNSQIEQLDELQWKGQETS